MNFIRKNFYIISFAILAIFISTIVIFRQKDPAVPLLKDRIGGISLGAEWTNTKKAIDGLIEKVRKNPSDLKSKTQLAQAYIQEGRITGDYNYYDGAALKLLEEVLEKQPNDFEALCSQATVYLNQHHFQQGLQVGLKTKKLYPHSAFVYGVLTDAYVELGKYSDAVRMADSMCGIRPDLRSYSRISYVREIYGDIPGAKDAMKMAVNSGVPGFEQTEWCRVYLGKLYESTGNIDTAELIYKASSIARPNYAYALAGLGRVERAKKNYDKAIKYFEQADALVNDYGFGAELIDLYQLTSQKEKADEISKEVIAKLNEHANSNDENGDAGHYADKELAYVYLKTGDVKLALEHAILEYNRRPDNIDINEMMAWVYFKNGEKEKAIPFIEKSLSTGSVNPELLCRSGIIYCSNNQTEKGSALIMQAININSFLQEDLMAEVKKYLPANAQLAAAK